MTLHDFLAANKTSEAAFATALGVSQVTVHRYVKGQRFPDKDTILKIERVTHGAVKPADWFERPLPTPTTSAEKGKAA